MKTRSISLLSLFALIALLFTACEGPNIRPCINGSGDRVIKTYSIQDFNEIELDIEATVYISKDTKYAVEIEAQQNILDRLTLEITGQRLEISSERCLKSHAPIEVRISLPEVRYLDLAGSGDMIGLDRFDTDQLTLRISGSGDIEFDADATQLFNRITGSGNITTDVTADGVESRITGSGKINLSGTSQLHEVNIIGSGDMLALGHTTDDCVINISGSGSAWVNVVNTIDVHISGSGDVHYKGNPGVTVNITGSGNVVDEN